MFKSLGTIIALCFATLFFVGCSKSEVNPTVSGSQKVVYKVIGSSDVVISTIVFYEGDGPVSRQIDGGNTWQSEEVLVNRTPTISVNAIGKNLESTLKVQILVEGKVIKESGQSKGKILVSTLSHIF